LERREVLSAVLPTGFNESVIVSGLKYPSSMEFAPDGRLFVTESAGAIRVVKNGVLLPQPFDTLPVESKVGQGLMAVTFDPHFATNHYVYAYYLADGANGLYFNRLVRITANGDTAVPGSEKVLLDLPPFALQAGFPAHDGAAIHFGADGKLYISTGELANGPLAQSLTNPFGKMLRINSDGTIPRDNPFYNQTTGVNRAIWALGLRNPFTFAVQPGTGLMYVNDVGASSWEEIDKVTRGANFGWPIEEGPSNNPKYVSPVYAYAHSTQADPGTVAITGGTFYNPPSPSFPAAFQGTYLFADYWNGWIDQLDPTTGKVQGFATGLPKGDIDLDVDPQGNLYFLNYWDGTIHEIQYSPQTPPTLPVALTTQVAQPGATVTFQALPSGSGPFTYQWQSNDVDIPNATGPTLSLPATPSNAAAQYRVSVHNAFGSIQSNEASFRIDPNPPPIAQILTPVTGASYRIGQLVYFRGVGSDPTTGKLPASDLTWSMDVLHNDHVHPNTFSLVGADHGHFRVPQHGAIGDKISYRLNLTVNDPNGETTTVSRIIGLRPSPAGSHSMASSRRMKM
jgi:glucose/arabinose dehydrogenase